MPQKGIEKRRSSENVISTDKSALLWMYCRGIAPFETRPLARRVASLLLAQQAPLRNAQPIPRKIGHMAQYKRATKELDHVSQDWFSGQD